MPMGYPVKVSSRVGYANWRSRENWARDTGDIQLVLKTRSRLDRLSWKRCKRKFQSKAWPLSNPLKVWARRGFQKGGAEVGGDLGAVQCYGIQSKTVWKGEVGQCCQPWQRGQEILWRRIKTQLGLMLNSGVLGRPPYCHCRSSAAAENTQQNE